MTTCTPLTEPQARALAQWWGGMYASSPPIAGTARNLRHGVTLPPCTEERAAANSLPSWVGTMEEARELESRRHGINPAAPDWDG